MEMRSGVIAAKSFHDRAGDGVAHQVCGEDLAVEFFVSIQPCESQIQSKIEERIKNLGWVNRYGGLASWMRFVRCGISDCPPMIATSASVAAAVKQAADAAEDVAESDAGSENVGRLPHRHLFPQRINQAR